MGLVQNVLGLSVFPELSTLIEIRTFADEGCIHQMEHAQIRQSSVGKGGRVRCKVDFLRLSTEYRTFDFSRLFMARPRPALELMA